MNEIALHPLPRWGAVVREQVRATGIGLRRELAAAGVLVFVITALLAISRFRGEWSDPIRMSPDEIGFVLGLVGFIAPLAVWKGEGPENRGYLWSMPLPRAGHTLVKVFGGWVWLMVALLALMAWVSVQVWLTGGGLGLDESRVVLAPGAVLPADGGTFADGALRELRWTTPGWMWLVPFVAPTITYLLGSIPTLLSDRPYLWLAFPFIAFMLFGAFAELADVRQVAEIGEDLLVGNHSLETLLTGSNEWRATITTAAGEEVRVWQNLAVPGKWFMTVLIWGLPALAGLLIAAHKYQER